MRVRCNSKSTLLKEFSILCDVKPPKRGVLFHIPKLKKKPKKKKKNQQKTNFITSKTLISENKKFSQTNELCTLPITNSVLYKDTVCCLEQTLEAARYKTAVVWLLTSHLTKHSSKMNKTYWALLEKKGQSHKGGFPMDSYRWTHQCWMTSKNLHSSALGRQELIGMDSEKELMESMLLA